MNFSKKAQISIEYMLIIGFVSLMTIPLLVIYFSFTQDSNTEISSAQLNQVGKRIVDAAESMYYIGEPSQTTLTVTIPQKIEVINLTGPSVVFKVRSSKGITDIVHNTDVNITGSLPSNEGTYKVTIVARSNYVEVSYT